MWHTALDFDLIQFRGSSFFSLVVKLRFEIDVINIRARELSWNFCSPYCSNCQCWLPIYQGYYTENSSLVFMLWIIPFDEIKTGHVPFSWFYLIKSNAWASCIILDFDAEFVNGSNAVLFFNYYLMILQLATGMTLRILCCEFFLQIWCSSCSLSILNVISVQ